MFYIFILIVWFSFVFILLFLIICFIFFYCSSLCCIIILVLFFLSFCFYYFNLYKRLWTLLKLTWNLFENFLNACYWSYCEWFIHACLFFLQFFLNYLNCLTIIFNQDVNKSQTSLCMPDFFNHFVLINPVLFL